MDFFAPRRCMREPIEDIFHAASILDRATEVHLEGDRSAAETLIRTADFPSVRAWTESLWGSRAANPDQAQYHRYRTIESAPPILPRELRIRKRMPSPEERQSIIDRYGKNCAFCGIPLISEEVRKAFQRAYPGVQIWGRTNKDCHAAFQCMWMQFDHVLPHSRGGDNTLENVIITCAPCNFGRMSWTLEEVGLIDPRVRPVCKTAWDGLQRFPHARA